MGLKATQSGIYLADDFGPDVLVAFSSRKFRTARHRYFLRELGIENSKLAHLGQVHDTSLVIVTRENIPQGKRHGDGLVTSSPGIALGIRTADCVPLFVWDPQRRVAGIAHAGWRGIYYGIVSKIVKAFRMNFRTDPKNLMALIGPAIRQCCYEVGAEFGDFFPDFFKAYADARDGGAGKGKMDLIGAVIKELEAGGVDRAHISDTGICTSCRRDEFFSNRHDKNTSERILSVIQIRA